jgi:hypothetical protein
MALLGLLNLSMEMPDDEVKSQVSRLWQCCRCWAAVLAVRPLSARQLAAASFLDAGRQDTEVYLVRQG